MGTEHSKIIHQQYKYLTYGFIKELIISWEMKKRLYKLNSTDLYSWTVNSSSDPNDYIYTWDNCNIYMLDVLI